MSDASPNPSPSTLSGRTVIVIAAIVAATAVAIAAIVVIGGHSSTNGSAQTKTTNTSTGSRPTTATTPPTTVPPTTTTTVPTTTTTTESPQASLIGVLLPFFANGCNGRCVDINEPSTAFKVIVDPNSPEWADWGLYDPNIGGGYGFALDSNGMWQVVAGPGSAGVGCPGGTYVVPAQILADFGATCPP
jgi:hypothetical protein